MSGSRSFEPDRLYPRCTELEDGRELNIYQSEIGDVGCVVWDAAIVLGKFYEHIAQTEKLSMRSDKDSDSILSQTNQKVVVDHITNDTLIRLGEIIAHCNVFEGSSKIIELGSGTGYVGIVAAACGARATITDLPEFVELMQYNIDKNQDIIEERTGKCYAKELTWGIECQDKADLILLADCIYYEQSLKPLVKTMVELSKPETLIICCHEERKTDNKPKLQKEYFDEVRSHFSVVRVPTNKQHPTYSSDDIHINILQLLPSLP